MLMRGVNVGGVKVPMAELSELLASLGLERVRTVLQSGNVAFDSARDSGELKQAIEPALGDRFGYEAFVQIYPLEKVARIVAAYPFAPQETRHRYVVFCADEETLGALLALPAGEGDVEQIEAGDGVVYWSVERGSTLQTPFAKAMARPRFKSVTTNRNVNTLEKLTRP